MLRDIQYRKRLPGCGSRSERIVRLNKPLHGLKQDARQLYKLLVSRLTELGFEQWLLSVRSLCDTSTFFHYPMVYWQGLLW